MKSAALLAASWATVGSRNGKGRAPEHQNDSLFFENVRFWAPCWAPVDSEGGPKNTFLVIMLGKTRKMRSRSGSRKNMKFKRKSDAKLGGQERQNVVISFDMLQNMRFWRSRIFMKIDAKLAPQIDAKSSLGRSRVKFFRFWEVFGGGRFFMFF